MGDAKIDLQVRKFIHRYIDSVELLEVLLLLHRKPSKAWSVAEVTEALRSTDSSIDNRLLSLERRGFVEEKEALFRFAPKTPELGASVDALADAYLTYRIRVVEEIYGSRTHSLRPFADAFKIRRESKD